MFKYVTEPSPTGTRVPRRAGRGRPAEGRLRLLAAAERLLATRGLEVPNREIVAAAGQHNQSAITYHFASRAGLIDAIRERHETPVAQHRQHLIARLPGPGERTTRQLVEAHVQPLAAEMLRCAPSYWARLGEMLLADQPRADPVLSELLELMVGHLSYLPELEAAGRVALTVRFLNAGLARWERDSQAGVDGTAPLAPFALILTDLAIAMLDAPSSVVPQIDAHLRLPHVADGRPSPPVRSGALLLDQRAQPPAVALDPPLQHQAGQRREHALEPARPDLRAQPDQAAPRASRLDDPRALGIDTGGGPPGQFRARADADDLAAVAQRAAGEPHDLGRGRARSRVTGRLGAHGQDARPPLRVAAVVGEHGPHLAGRAVDFDGRPDVDVHIPDSRAAAEVRQGHSRPVPAAGGH